MQYIKQARKIVNKNLEKISARSKKRFDKNRQEIEFYPGDLVYLKKPNRKVGLSEKLLPQYSGPWEIIMKTASNNYQITNHTRKKIDIVNVERLKKFNK
uniref:Tf2-1-like SH3-like domain-containing protein n=1 Tax=Strigamia maritima TaxID=126957 RepID=T1IYU5_STRMM